MIQCRDVVRPWVMGSKSLSMKKFSAVMRLHHHVMDITDFGDKLPDNIQRMK